MAVGCPMIVEGGPPDNGDDGYCEDGDDEYGAGLALAMGLID